MYPSRFGYEAPTDIWEVAADELPDAPCLIHGDDVRTWAEVDRRADGVAQLLIDAAAEPTHAPSDGPKAAVAS